MRLDGLAAADAAAAAVAAAVRSPCLLSIVVAGRPKRRRRRCGIGRLYGVGRCLMFIIAIERSHMLMSYLNKICGQFEEQ